MLKKTISTFWLVASLSAIFISCKKEDLTVGSTFQNEEGTFSFSRFTEEDFNFSYATLLKKKTLTTQNEGNLIIGSQSGNAVADLEINSFVQLDLSTANFDFGVNPVCDSIVLFLSYQDNNPANRYVQGTGVTEIVVKEVLEDIVSDSVSSIGFETASEELGSVVFNGGADAEGTEVKLSVSFGDKMIGLANGKSSDEFKQSFKGLALLSGDASTMISSINPLDDNTTLKLYYRNDAGSAEYNFNIGEDGLIEHIQVLSSTTNSYSALVADGDLVEASVSGNKTGLASGAGVHTLVRLNGLSAALDTLEDAIVNKAVFTFNVDPSLYADITGEAPLVIELIITDENGTHIPDSDGNKQIVVPYLNVITGGGTGLFALNKDDKKYQVDITAYVQEALLNNRELNSLLLSTDVNIADVSYNARFRETTLSVQDIAFELVYSKL